MKELGNKFSFIESEYKIKIGDRFNYIDLLLFNYKYNAFVVVELKVTEFKSEYIAQVQKYMNYIDKNVKEWADTCMEFVYKDLGYKKEQILYATVHLDEKTPHIHFVVIPLVKKFDKRTNTERYTISKKQYIKDKIQLSQLQDMYHKRLTEKGYDLDRGIKGSDNKHIKIKEYKRMTKK